MADKPGATAASRLVTRQVQTSLAVEASVRELGRATADGLTRRVAALYADHEAVPDFAACQDALGRLLAGGRRRVREAGAEVEREKREATRLRKLRERARVDLIDQLRRAQSLILFLYGQDRSPVLLGIGGGLQYLQRERLIPVARAAVAELRQPDAAAWADGLAPGQALPSLENTAQAIEAPLRELESALAELPASRRRLQAALGAKDEAMTILAQDLQRASQALEALYRLAGLEFHAERLRPTERRSTPNAEADQANDHQAVA